MNPDTFTTLTARRARLETTRIDLADRLKGHTAELQRLDTDLEHWFKANLA